MAQMIDTFSLNYSEADARRWDDYRLPRGAKIVEIGGGQIHVWAGPIAEIEAEYSEAAGEPRKLVRWAKARQTYTLG